VERQRQLIDIQQVFATWRETEALTICTARASAAIDAPEHWRQIKRPGGPGQVSLANSHYSDIASIPADAKMKPRFAIFQNWVSARVRIMLKIDHFGMIFYIVPC